MKRTLCAYVFKNIVGIESCNGCIEAMQPHCHRIKILGYGSAFISLGFLMNPDQGMLFSKNLDTKFLTFLYFDGLLILLDVLT